MSYSRGYVRFDKNTNNVRNGALMLVVGLNHLSLYHITKELNLNNQWHPTM